MDVLAGVPLTSLIEGLLAVVLAALVLTAFLGDMQVVAWRGRQKGADTREGAAITRYERIRKRK